MTHKYGIDPASDFLKDAGDDLRNGGYLNTRKQPAQNATTLADSPPQIKGNTKGRRGPGINLRKVAEVLEEQELDPMVEIVRILKSKTLDPTQEVRVLTELLQYYQPKLKAIEINATVMEMTPEQRHARLTHLLGKGFAGLDQAV
jgi:hypothetical protein